MKRSLARGVAGVGHPGAAQHRFEHLKQRVVEGMRGHEVVDSFVVRGVINISVPIIDHSGHAVAALTVPHIERFGEAVSLADCCMEAIGIADKLTRRLGGGAVDPRLRQVK